jgi:hypothetical protein
MIQADQAGTEENEPFRTAEEESFQSGVETVITTFHIPLDPTSAWTP